MILLYLLPKFFQRKNHYYYSIFKSDYWVFDMNLYDFRAERINGEMENLSKYKGKVVLIVNTATHCGFTPQLNDLEELYENYKDKGLEILSFPCDQFYNQTPESNDEVYNICTTKYHVTFPQFAKVDVNGDNAIPLYKWITENTVFRGLENIKGTKAFHKLIWANDKNFQQNGNIKWNFTKILIDQNGNIVERFESPISTKIIEYRIRRLLKADETEGAALIKERIEALRTKSRLRSQSLKYVGIAFLPIMILFWLASSASMLISNEGLSFYKVAIVFLKISPLAIAVEVGMYLILHKYVKQNQKLSDALERATSGDLDYRFTWNQGDPMARIYANYNQMCQQLKVSRNQMEEAVLEANHASEAKSAFLSNMSHEIRTPINAVLGLDEMIVRESRESNIKSYAIDIKSAGRSLLSLVNDILDFSKIESGKMDIIPVEYDLSSVINDLLNMNNDKAQKKGLSLRVNIEESIPKMLYGDEIRIKQVALNILSNAVKYTDEGWIELNVSHKAISKNKIKLIFHIIDTGKGIKEEDLDKLFRPFERIEEKRNRSIEGTGLGMNITKQLLDMMDSQLVVDSTYGKGSDFSFEIVQEVVADIPIGDFAESYKKYKDSTIEYRESFHAPDARILVVDDVEMNLNVFTSLLKMTQIQIDTATSGRNCLELADINKYDIIFIDHMMPDMDGIETLKVLRSECAKNIDTPVMILTANAVSGAREKYIAEGFSDYLTKPIDSAKLEATIAEYLPSEKLIKDFDVEEIKSEMVVRDSSIESQFAKICKVEGIDTSSGIRATGSIDTYVSTAKIFATTGKNKHDQIKEYCDSQDIKNYTIQVHALKSNARLIGADFLSESAKYLEQMGNDGNIPQIKEKTDALLAEYERIYTSLSEIFVSEAGEKLITKEKFLELLNGLKAAVDNFDLDTADLTIEEIDKYKIEGDLVELLNQVKEAIADVDQERALDNIEKLINSIA